MAIKKSELYSSLWAGCDELRGGMDASQYKDYVLVLLFLKYVSDKYAGEAYAPINIPPGATFADMVALKGKSDIGDQINKRIIAPLVKAIAPNGFMARSVGRSPTPAASHSNPSKASSNSSNRIFMPDFSIGLDYAWRTAANEVTTTRHEFIEPEHLFIGVCKLGNLLSLKDWSETGISPDAAAVMKIEAEAVAAVFQQTGCDRIALYREVRKQLGDGKHTEKGRKKISRSPASRLIFERAVKLAADMPVVTSLHLLLALIETPSTAIAAALTGKTPGAETMKKVIQTWIAASPSPQQPAAASFLQHFGKDLTQLARDGKISPCIGRRDELLQIIRALSRETKSNPLLLGDARPMRRTIEQAVENPLAAMLVRAEIKSGDQVVVGLRAEALTFEIKHKGAL